MSDTRCVLVLKFFHVLNYKSLNYHKCGSHPCSVPDILIFTPLGISSFSRITCPGFLGWGMTGSGQCVVSISKVCHFLEGEFPCSTEPPPPPELSFSSAKLTINVPDSAVSQNESDNNMVQSPNPRFRGWIVWARNYPCFKPPRFWNCLLLQHNLAHADWYIKEGKKYLQFIFMIMLNRTHILALKACYEREKCPIYIY